MKADLQVIEWRITRKRSALDEATIEYVCALRVNGAPVPTKEPIIIVRKVTSAESELLNLLLQEEKGEI